MNDECRRTYKKPAVAYFKVLSRMHTGDEENHAQSQLIQAIPGESSNRVPVSPK